MANSINLYSAYYYTFRNISMTAYMTETQKKFKFNSLNLTNLRVTCIFSSCRVDDNMLIFKTVNLKAK